MFITPGPPPVHQLIRNDKTDKAPAVSVSSAPTFSPVLRPEDTGGATPGGGGHRGMDSPHSQTGTLPSPLHTKTHTNTYTQTYMFTYTYYISPLLMEIDSSSSRASTRARATSIKDENTRALASSRELESCPAQIFCFRSFSRPEARRFTTIWFASRRKIVIGTGESGRVVGDEWGGDLWSAGTEFGLKIDCCNEFEWLCFGVVKSMFR